MNNERIISLGTNSMIYHKRGCKYVERIKGKNKMILSRGNARDEGYHICRCCNSMNHHYRTEKDVIDFYTNVKKMQFNLVNGVLYVKSELGCWKVVYLRKEERFVLYHRSNTIKPLDFEHPEHEPYHRQGDKPFANSIEEYLDYIYKHDKYKAAVERGEKITKFSSKKYAKREAKAERKRQLSRVDYLFRVLERENEGLKALSCC